jgi:site-specific DNA-methyltransferase (adenine-specific)
MSDVQSVTIGKAHLFYGDCLEVLPLMEGLADMICCDVAYELTSGGNAHQSMGGLFAADQYQNDGKLMAVSPWEDLGGPFLRACAPDADAYIMTNDKNLFRAGNAFEGAGWKFHNLLVWDKIRATRNRWYMKNLEFTIYFWKGRADPQGINDCGSKQSFPLNAPKVSEHPTEKPTDLMRHYIINSSEEGDTVLDPMMGSGSTVVAAVEAGRCGVGIEYAFKWFKVACERVAKAQDLPMPDLTNFTLREGDAA